MTSTTIRSYKDLQKEKARLEILLSHQKAEFKTNLEVLKQDYAPVIKLGSAIGMLTTRNFRYPLLNMIAGMVINSVIKNRLLARAGWVTRLLVPFFLKNASSNLIKKRAKKIFAKVGEFLKNTNEVSQQ